MTFDPQTGYQQPWQPPVQQAPGYTPQYPPDFQPRGATKPPKRHLLLKTIGISAFGVVCLVIGIAIGAAGKSSSTPSTTSGTTAPGVSNGIGSQNATADITLGAVTVDAIGETHVQVNYLNHSSKRSDYDVSLSLESANGATQYGTAESFEQNVDPGQHAVDDAVFLTDNPPPAGAKVVIKSVQRTASG